MRQPEIKSDGGHLIYITTKQEQYFFPSVKSFSHDVAFGAATAARNHEVFIGLQCHHTNSEILKWHSPLPARETKQTHDFSIRHLSVFKEATVRSQVSTRCKAQTSVEKEKKQKTGHTSGN